MREINFSNALGDTVMEKVEYLYLHYIFPIKEKYGKLCTIVTPTEEMASIFSVDLAPEPPNKIIYLYGTLYHMKDVQVIVNTLMDCNEMKITCEKGEETIKFVWYEKANTCESAYNKVQ